MLGPINFEVWAPFNFELKIAQSKSFSNKNKSEDLIIYFLVRVVFQTFYVFI